MVGLLAGCGTVVPPALPRDEIVYVIGRGWHTDIGLSADEIAGPLAALKAPFPGVRYLTFGFGDRTFLLNRTVTTFGMLAALWPGRGALLVTALRAPPEEAFGPSHVVALHVTQNDLHHLQATLWQQFQTTPAAAPIMLTNGPYDGSLFYAASAGYSGVYTCNTWTAEMMRASGLPMPAAGVLFAGQVMGMARWIARHQE